MTTETLVMQPGELSEHSYEIVSSVSPHRRLLTVEEFDHAWALGVYGPEERLELIEGEVIEKVTPQESPHATGTNLSGKAAEQAFGEEYHVRTQLPL